MSKKRALIFNPVVPRGTGTGTGAQKKARGGAAEREARPSYA